MSGVDVLQKAAIWHCENCGYEHVGSQYNWHPKGCPECRKQKWQDGRTADCSKCDIHNICHEPIKDMCPTYRKTCLHFRIGV